MGGKMSKEKGKRGEREFARLCRDEGYSGARRGQQFDGLEGEDVVGLPGIHVEVKRVEKFSLYDALAQAKADANGKVPIVAHRRNNCKWVIVMEAEDWFKVYREWEAGRPPDKKGETEPNDDQRGSWPKVGCTFDE